MHVLQYVNGNVFVKGVHVVCVKKVIEGPCVYSHYVQDIFPTPRFPSGGTLRIFNDPIIVSGCMTAGNREADVSADEVRSALVLIF